MSDLFPNKRPSWPWYFPGVAKLSTESDNNSVLSNEQYARVKRRELEEFKKRKSIQEEAEKPLVRTPSTLHPKMKAKDFYRWRKLMREVYDLYAKLPDNMQMEIIDDKNIVLALTVEEYFYRGGTFEFQISIPENYNSSAPGLKCLTPIFHPAIDEKTGLVNLRILEKFPKHQWKLNNKRLMHLIEGLQSLFKFNLYINTPVNIAALDMFRNNLDKFIFNVEKDVCALCAINRRTEKEIVLAPSEKLPKYNRWTKITNLHVPGTSRIQKRQ